ncbi:hypothetical protein AB6D40_022710 [Vibrio cyclitrophicus]
MTHRVGEKTKTIGLNPEFNIGFFTVNVSLRSLSKASDTMLIWI